MIREGPLQSHEKFDIEKSFLKEAYLLLNARTPLELSNRYTVEDQKIMKSRSWDYENPDLITNKIKNILEATNVDAITESERRWRQEILWFWYHHAISCAIWRYKDKEKAQIYATQALKYQDENHPNQITRLLDFLVNERLPEAEGWARTITDNDEKVTAAELIDDYKNGRLSFN